MDHAEDYGCSSDEEEEACEDASPGSSGRGGGGADGEAAGGSGGGEAGLAAEDSEPGDLTCAICLHSIPLENLAMIKVRPALCCSQRPCSPTCACDALGGRPLPGAARWAAGACVQGAAAFPLRCAAPPRSLLTNQRSFLLLQGCDHMYCATCILHWALHKAEPWCPQCKQPFDTLLTYRTLDGELQVPAGCSCCRLAAPARLF